VSGKGDVERRYCVVDVKVDTQTAVFAPFATKRERE